MSHASPTNLLRYFREHDQAIMLLMIVSMTRSEGGTGADTTRLHQIVQSMQILNTQYANDLSLSSFSVGIVAPRYKLLFY